jgi:hypothetical protein
MDDAAKQDRRMAGEGGVASRLPWRCGEAPRARLAALAVRRRRFASGGQGAGKAGVDIDDHIRLAVREESAATLGRAGSRLQEAVAALGDFDRCQGTGAAHARRPLLYRAAGALWQFIVQREAVGLTSHELVDELYGVTPELWRLMGSAEAVCCEATLPGQRSAR